MASLNHLTVPLSRSDMTHSDYAPRDRLPARPGGSRLGHAQRG
ncbi:hypothetical protein ATSB10_12990 [Dyella thiooxydans]|uniref:Uncharacterized protein n=1 Tax=Dyella thiooxydans TaxID=445710 RepID=A0A160MZC8_9GAMM|nr:hypothetical protein ATSB10_12990 [Dyella thiooxydans]